MLQIALLGTDRPSIWLVESCYRVGKAAVCDIQLNDDTLLDVHLQLNVDGDRLTLKPASGALVLVNGARVPAGSVLNHGDRLKLGRSELAIVDPKIAIRAGGAAGHAVADGALGDGSSADVLLKDVPLEDVLLNESTWILQGLGTALSDKRYAISGTMVAGRSQECDLCLAVAHLSRQHARLSLGPKGLRVDDLGSANGTFINGKRINRGYVKNGDELRFDTVRFRVLGPGADTDPDKTKVRPVMPAMVAKPSSPAPAKQRAAQSQVVDPVVMVATAAALTESRQVSHGSPARIWYVCLALLMVIGGIFWALGR